MYGGKPFGPVRRCLDPPRNLRADYRPRGIRGWWWRLEETASDRVTSPQACATTRDGKLQRLEAVLFLAREPLSSRKLAEFAGLADGTEARVLVRKLNRYYDMVGRAFRVEEVAGGFQLLTRPKFASWLRRLGHVPGELRLSPPVLETLAVIAYRQPILRADIEAIRGVNCGEILRQLMDRQLIRICGRSDELGRPYLYGTTRKFLQLFGLPNIDKLPPIETMPDISPGDAEGKEPGVDGTSDEAHNNRLQNLDETQKEDRNVTVSTFRPMLGLAPIAADGVDAACGDSPIPELVAARRRDEDEEDDEYDDEEEDFEDFDEEEDEYDEEDYEEDYEDEEEDEYDEEEDEDYDDEDYDDEDDWESVEDEEDIDDDWEDDEDDWDDDDDDDDDWD